VAWIAGYTTLLMEIAGTMALKSATLFSDRDGAEHAKPYGAFSASAS
jgi:hypothetical protein